MRFFSSLLLLLVCTVALAKPTPVPLINQPLVPTSAAPGSKGFTLTIHGTGFASDAVVNWNGSPRVTSVISSSTVQAIINASDVAKAGTASVTVANPEKRNRISNTVFFPIRDGSAKVAFSIDPQFSASGAVTVGDFNNDGKLDVAVGNSAGVAVYLGKGGGSFRNPIQTSVNPPTAMVAADVNNDGKLDLLVAGPEGQFGEVYVTVLLGDGTGKFSQYGSTYAVGLYGGSIAVGDLNGDGNLDFVVTGGTSGTGNADAYLGDGHGGFQYTASTAAEGVPALGDFNGDGNLDLAVPTFGPFTSVNICLGNGDGTFQPCSTYDTGLYVSAVATADLKHNGKLDVITDGVAVLLNNGDGTFSMGATVTVGAYGGASNPIGIGDLNGDGNVDVAVFDFSSSDQVTVAVLLGRGNGQFRNPVELGAGSSQFEGLALGDFNGTGQLAIVAAGQPALLFLQTAASVSPAKLSFGEQNLGTRSKPKTDTLTNVGSSPLTIKKIGLTGADSNDFAEKNNCPASLPAGQSCQIKVTFDPNQSGPLSASLSVSYEGVGSPETVSLSGTGKSTTVSLTPSEFKFPIQLVGTKSAHRTATLTNTGNGTIDISNISTTGPFQQTNNCPSSLQSGGSCQIQVDFDPQTKGPATGKLSVEDDATGSPQTVALSGNATVVVLSPEGVNFGDQKVGTKSPSAPVTLTNKGKTALSIGQITIIGKDATDFEQTNNCGTSVPAHGQCKIKVTFEPTAKGARSAAISVGDDGGGSPQAVALAGTGT